LGAVQSTLGVGGCGNICFGSLLVAVRQGQHRDTVAAGVPALMHVCTVGACGTKPRRGPPASFEVNSILKICAWGNAGGASGGKARSTEAQTNIRE
jgi:hypothetical protein